MHIYPQIEQKYLAEAESRQCEAGTTAVVAIVYGNKLFVGNVGDSEAILARKLKPTTLSKRSSLSQYAHVQTAHHDVVLLSSVHAPRNKAEAERVKREGGTIHTNGKLCHPLWNPFVIGLGVTRAIGDVYFKLPKFTDGKKTGM